MKNNTEAKNNYSWLLNVALLLAYLTMVINVSTMSWQTGYLGYFMVPIRDIDYAPKMFEFATIGFVAVTSIVVVMIMAVLVFVCAKKLTDYLQRRASVSRIRWFRFLFGDETPIFTKTTLLLMCAVMLFGATYKVCYTYFENRGKEMAEMTTNFSAIENNDERAKVVVYQSSNVGIVKTYDKVVEQFDNSFEIIELTGLRLDYVEIVKSD